MSSFLNRMGFVSRSTKVGLLWRHSKYSDLIISYTSSDSGKLRKESVRDIAAVCHKLEEYSQSSQGSPQIEILSLPDAFNNQLSAVRQGDQIAFSYNDFPEFRMSMHQTDFSEAALIRSIRNVERKFQSVFDKLKELQEKYGLQVDREDGKVLFGLPAIDVELELEVTGDFETMVFQSLFEIERKATDYRDERELEFHDLTSRGYEVEERDSALIIRDPTKPDLEEISIGLDFATMVSPDTARIYDRLERRYPVKETPAAVVAAPAVAAETVVKETYVQELHEAVETEKVIPAEISTAHPVSVSDSAQNDADEKEDNIPVSATPALPQPQADKNSTTTRLEPAPAPAAATKERSVSEPTPITTSPSYRRPVDVLVPKSRRFAVTLEGYEDTFGGRIVRHRNERNMTEQALAEAIKDLIEKQQAKRINGDTIEEWQRNKKVPGSKEEYNALRKVLIEENPKLLEGDKAAALLDFGRAYRETRALVYNTKDETHSDRFGVLVSKYRRQLGMTEDEVGNAVAGLLETVIEENLQEFDYNDVARMQAGMQVPSRGVFDAMIRVFDGASSGPLKAQKLEDEERVFLLEAYEIAKKTIPTISGNTKQEESPITQEDRALRTELLATFVHKNGQPCSIADISRMAEVFSPLNANDVANHLSAKANQYSSMSDKKIDSVKETLKVIQQDLGADETRLAKFAELFDKLTARYLDWKKNRGSQIGARADEQQVQRPEPAQA